MKDGIFAGKKFQGALMEKKGTIQRISNKKRGRPKVRFNFWILIIIFALSFMGCFALYMIAANTNDDFLDDSDDKVVVQEQATEASTESEGAEPATEAAAPQENTAEIINPVPQSEAVDETYFDSACLVTDSTLLEMGSHTALKDVIGNAQLNAAACNDVNVESNYGTVTVYQVMQLKKPTDLYIMLGSDIGTSEVDDMVSAYTTLVSDVHSYLPDTKIYIMQLPPAAYDTETVTNEKINLYNGKILGMARNLGVYCIDTNTALKSAEGVLAEEYWDAENGKLSEAAYKAISDYIRTHTA